MGEEHAKVPDRVMSKTAEKGVILSTEQIGIPYYMRLLRLRGVRNRGLKQPIGSPLEGWLFGVGSRN